MSFSFKDFVFILFLIFFSFQIVKAKLKKK